MGLLIICLIILLVLFIIPFKALPQFLLLLAGVGSLLVHLGKVLRLCEVKLPVTVKVSMLEDVPGKTKPFTS